MLFGATLWKFAILAPNHREVCLQRTFRRTFYCFSTFFSMPAPVNFPTNTAALVGFPRLQGKLFLFFLFLENWLKALCALVCVCKMKIFLFFHFLRFCGKNQCKCLLARQCVCLKWKSVRV